MNFDFVCPHSFAAKFQQFQFTRREANGHKCRAIIAFRFFSCWLLGFAGWVGWGLLLGRRGGCWVLLGDGRHGAGPISPGTDRDDRRSSPDGASEYRPRCEPWSLLQPAGPGLRGLFAS